MEEGLSPLYHLVRFYTILTPTWETFGCYHVTSISSEEGGRGHYGPYICWDRAASP